MNGDQDACRRHQSGNCKISKLRRTIDDHDIVVVFDFLERIDDTKMKQPPLLALASGDGKRNVIFIFLEQQICRDDIQIWNVG